MFTFETVKSNVWSSEFNWHTVPIHQHQQPSECETSWNYCHSDTTVGEDIVVSRVCLSVSKITRNWLQLWLWNFPNRRTIKFAKWQHPAVERKTRIAVSGNSSCHNSAAIQPNHSHHV